MKTPWDFFQSSRTKIKNTWKIAFLSAFVLGILIHLPVMLSDIPNHDGLSSMYFDQNMITSGRWFLSVACGFSSYFTIPWIIGLIGLLWLALTAVALTELLELADPLVIMAVSGLLVSFPALASTFAYVFTMDGYMMALFLAILAVLFTKKQKKGWLAGAVCLAFSMGIYQAYLPFAILLCVYVILLFFMEEKGWKTKAFYVPGHGSCRSRIVLRDPADSVEITGKGAGYLSGDQFHGAGRFRSGAVCNDPGNVC